MADFFQKIQDGRHFQFLWISVTIWPVAKKIKKVFQITINMADFFALKKSMMAALFGISVSQPQQKCIREKKNFLGKLF
jgi:hypothetical protein